VWTKCAVLGTAAQISSLFRFVVTTHAMMSEWYRMCSIALKSLPAFELSVFLPATQRRSLVCNTATPSLNWLRMTTFHTYRPDFATTQIQIRSKCTE